METLQIELETEKQKSIVMELLQELQITYRTVTSEKEENELYGERLKQIVLEGKKAYESGDTSQFTRIKTTDLWK